MDPQTIIDTATTANAVALGNTLATEYFREKVKGSYVVEVSLLETEKRYLKRIVDFPILFKGSYTVTHDHNVVVAIRGLCRDIMERTFSVSRTTDKTLIVGSSHREIKLYNSNEHIHFYVYGGENKIMNVL